MRFKGFNSVGEFESACGRSNMITVRVPLVRRGESFFLLIVGLPHKTSSSVETWRVFREDESAMLLEGVISSGEMLQRHIASGVSPDVNFLDKLDAAGFSFKRESDRDIYRNGIGLRNRGSVRPG